MFNYLFITNVPEIAVFAESYGVSRIFIDLESNGKLERQGHLDTVISNHSFDDIHKVKKVLNSSELLVRLNPFYENTAEEVERAILGGADIIMLPMIKSTREVIELGNLIDKRVKFIPLIETKASAESIEEISKLACVDELHVGLNDLHLELGLNFMFQLISNGYVDEMVKNLKKPYGIGGIARASQGEISGKSVMAQHVRLKSSGVILSRAFHMRASSLVDLKGKIDLSYEISLLESFRKQFSTESIGRVVERKTRFNQSVEKVGMS